MTWLRGCALAALLGAWACSGGPRSLDSGAYPDVDPTGARILTSVGFGDRGDWPSTVLHMDASEIGGRSRLSLILGRSDRVQIKSPVGTEWGVHLVGADGEGACPVAVYRNGSRVGRRVGPGEILGLDDLLAAEDIAGLELHAGPEGPIIPVSECGTLLIWTSAADPAFGFFGEISAVVGGASADRVTSVVLQPGAVAGRRQGAYTFFSVLPGEYEVHFLGADGPLDVRPVRAYAGAESEVVLEVNQ